MKKLKERINNLGLKHVFIAQKLDIHKTLLSHYLNETRDMPDDLKKELTLLLQRYE